MNSEERLDHLLARREPDEVLSDTETAQMAAADDIQRLQTIPFPTAFAERLQSQVRARARALHDAATSADCRSVTPRSVPRRHFRRTLRQVWGISASACIVFGLLGVALVNASAQSVPGDWLYSLKQLRNQIALSQAQTAGAKAQIALQQLQSALADFNDEVAHHRSDADIHQSLTVLVGATTTAQVATNALSASSERTTAQVALSQELAKEEGILHHLLGQVDWPIRVMMSTQLGNLGAVVPQIIGVIVTRQRGMIVLDLQGAHFGSGIQVSIDGQLVGAPTEATATTLLVSVTVPLWDGHDHAVGVQNSDGTAAEISVANGGQMDGKGNTPPVPSATPDKNGHPHATPTPAKGHHSGG